MIWRRSLPARVALATTAMLGLLLLLLVASAYSLTALLLRQGVDMALLTALPVQSRDLSTLLARANEFERRDPGARFVQVITLDGVVEVGTGALPVDPEALANVRVRGMGFASARLDDGALTPRTGPDWWQALTPVPGEVRIMYVPTGRPPDIRVLQVGMPIGMIGDILPRVFRGMALLSLLGILVAGFVTWRMAGETYRPLRAIMDVADEVNTKTLSVRVPGGWQDETLSRLTTALNAMIARLEEAFETQGRFVASAAHELRSPLAAMRAELEVTLRRTRSPKEYEEALTGALEETGRLTTLAEHLLILARYERGASLAMEDDVSLASLLERVGEEMRASSGQDVRVTAPVGLTVTCDLIALERMVANLIRNAIEAGGAPVEVEAGGVPVEAEAGGTTAGDPCPGARQPREVWISVRDHGPGIPAETVPLLFEPFYRADPARRRDGGAGLGLAIVKAIIDAHKGRIDVENVADGGVRFVVWLPRDGG